MFNPLVSVVMSVFNGERNLRESIESILTQSFRDFEFIIIDDGSTDATAGILAGYQKSNSRVAVYRQENKGLIASLNTGCRLARGRYIARMDADDVAAPQRLERQVSYLEANPHIVVLGSAVNITNASTSRLSTMSFPIDNEVIKEWLFESRGAAFCHVTVVFRSEVFRAAHGYRPAFLAAEDYDLWLRIAERWQVANLPEPLVDVRRRAHSLSFTHAQQQVISVLAAWAASAIRRAEGRDPICQEEPVSRDLLTRLGVSDAVFEKSLMGVYQYWIGVMLQMSDQAAALKVLHEVLGQSWSHIDKSIVANAWLLAARIYSEQGRHLQSMKARARALATRPIIAGRPFKHIVSRLGLLSEGSG